MSSDGILEAIFLHCSSGEGQKMMYISFEKNGPTFTERYKGFSLLYMQYHTSISLPDRCDSHLHFLVEKKKPTLPFRMTLHGDVFLVTKGGITCYSLRPQI